MRILFIIHQFYPEFQSGTEKVTLELARSAQRDGHRVTILTRSIRELSFWQGEEESGLRTTSYQGLKVVAFPQQIDAPLADLGFDRSLGMSDEMANFFDRHGPFDVAHVMHCLRMFDVVDAIRALGIAYIVTLTDFLLTCHRINLTRVSGQPCNGPDSGRNCAVFCPVDGHGETPFVGRLARMRAILSNAKYVTTCSSSVSAVFEQVFPGLKVDVIEHGVDLLAFGSTVRKANSGTLTFGYLGTLTPVKGVDILMRAFVEACLGRQARLKIVGPSFDHKYMQMLRGIADGDDGIEIGGAVSGDGIRRTLESFDVLCVPSIVPETFSLVLFEGFASGLPCIVSDLGHPAAVVRNHRCGEVATHGDVKAWTESLTQIARDPALVERYRRRLPVPCRIEEEGFRYIHKYHTLYSPSSE